MIAKTVPKMFFRDILVFMKIEGPKSSSELNKKKDAKKTSSGDGAFKSMMGTESAQSAGGAGLTSGIASMDILLAAQSVDNSTQGKAKHKAKLRAKGILEKLNDLKVAMVSGNVTIGHMISIADVVATHRENITDPELTAILDEIDLRAHVELAKLEVAKSYL